MVFRDKEDQMLKKRRKVISFDAMVKFFMQNYNIPTKKDVDRLMEKIGQLESLLKTMSLQNLPAPQPRSAPSRKSVLSASDQVQSVISHHKNGIAFAVIQKKTGFEEKKLRNIIFRLNKLERIKSKSRGIYTAI